MKPTQLTNNREAIQIGLTVSAGVALLLFVVLPTILQVTIFATNALIVVFLFGITGALLGKLLSRTRSGAWLGAVLMLMLLGGWLYIIASAIPLD